MCGLAKNIPKFTLGFGKDGLKINNKKFHPLNVSVHGIAVESDKEYKPVDAGNLLDSLISLRNVRSDDDAGKVNVLKTLLDKVNS